MFEPLTRTVSSQQVLKALAAWSQVYRAPPTPYLSF